MEDLFIFCESDGAVEMGFKEFACVGAFGLEFFPIVTIVVNCIGESLGVAGVNGAADMVVIDDICDFVLVASD